MGIFSRRSKAPADKEKAGDPLANYVKPKPTGLRLLVAVMYIISLVFLILVEIGNINNMPVIRSTYFLKIDLANVIPNTVPNAIFINSIARSIGLHDFYQVGLWNFCEGYNGEGITDCSNTQTLYWFNPVEIILNQLLAGASISLPTDVTNILDIVQIASNWMWACFLVGACLTFLCIFICPMGFSKKPRWQHKAKRIFLRQLPITLLAFLAALFTTVATVVATVMFIIFRNTFAGAADLNIEAHIGSEMFAFMWIATGFNLIGLIIQLGTCCGVCCCTGRRKAERISRTAVSNHEAHNQTATTASSDEETVVAANSANRRRWGFGKK
ncbi:uncharacterized protein AB675_651 [Cyphellophora attinorum]|uniref:SUR7 family protein pun1 n=1 Tax=Cyphellophora attinorum TaxID=1664694 RepID=A0A0N1P3Q7_9EURO|nr:uncharacterized protein AB675_651 [Phialophora attinorum]KPI45983.1 hypothetical protein AB675_651 [Phialophora attinorum]